MSEEFKILLGAELESDTESNINLQISNLKIDPIKIQIDGKEFENQLKSIKEQIEDLNKIGSNGNKKKMLPVSSNDISNLNKSFDSLVKSIDEIKSSLGSLNKDSGMKSLLVSINDISTALGGVESQFRELSTTIKGMDFSVNIGLGNTKNPILAANEYGNAARNNAIPQLKKQVNELQKYIKTYYGVTDEFKAFSTLIRGTSVLENTGTDIFSLMNGINNPKASLKMQMDAFVQYINVIKEAAKLKGIDLSSVTSGFSKSAEELVQDTQQILKGESDLEKQTQRLKDIFGTNILNNDFSDLTSKLDEIIKSLREIEQITKDLSSGVSISGLTDSFNNLSSYIKQIVENCSDLRLSFDNNADSANNVNNVIRDTESIVNRISNIKIGDIQLESTIDNLSNVERAMQDFGFDKSVIDSTISDLEKINVSINSISTKLNEDGSINLTVKGVDSLNNAVTAVKRVWQELDKESPIERMVTKTDGFVTVTQRFNQVEKQSQETKDAINELIKVSDKIKKLDISIASLDDEKNKNEIEVLRKQLVAFEEEYKRLENSISQPLTSNQFSKLSNDIADTINELSKLEAKLKDAQSNKVKDIKTDVNNGTLDRNISNIEGKFQKLNIESEEVTENIKYLRSLLSSMDESDNIESVISNYNKFKETLTIVDNQVEKLKIKQQELKNTTKLNYDRKAAESNIDIWMSKNSAAVNEVGSRVAELKARLKECDEVELKNILSEFNELKRQAQLAGKTGLSFFDKIKKKFSDYGFYLSTAMATTYLVNSIRDMYTEVVKVDTAMTELKKVTDETDESYRRFLSNAGKRAKEIGTTIDGLVTSTADFARLGYGFKDSQKLAEVANIYAVVGDEIDSVDTATKSLISTMTAFHIESSNAMSVIDKFNEVGNNFAISSGGIGDALEKSASSLASANNTLDQSIALITAANTVVQNPDSVGNAFKTISMRIRGAKSELEDAGLETEGMADSTAKLRKEIMALSGIDLMLNENTFKSTYQILDELSSKWENLTDIQQASITELLAGKRQGNVLSSLMSNFDIARKALETSLDSEGSAMAEHEKWMQSLEARLQKLQAAWQSLSQTFLDSDSLKVTIDILVTLISTVDSLIQNIGLLETVALAVGTGAFIKNINTFKDLANIMDTFGGSLNNLNGIKEFKVLIDALGGSSFENIIKITEVISKLNSLNETTDGIKSIKDISNMMSSFDGGKDAIDNVASALKSLSNESKIAILSIFNLSEEQAKAILTSAGLAGEELATAAATVASGTAAQGAAVGFTAFSASIKSATAGLVAFLLTNPVGWLILATTAIYGTVKAIDFFTESLDEAKEKAEESRQAFEETTSEIKSLKSQLEETNDKIKEIRLQGVISVADQEEISKIEAQNEQLDRQLKIKQRLFEYQQKEAAKDANNVLLKKTSYTDNETGLIKTSDIIEETKNNQERLNEQTEIYNNLIKRNAELSQDKDAKLYSKWWEAPTEYEQNEKLIKTIGNEIDSLNGKIVNNLDEINAQYSMLFDEDGNILSGYEDTVNRANEVIDSSLSSLDGLSDITNTASNIAETLGISIDKLIGNDSEIFSSNIDSYIEKVNILQDSLSKFNSDDLSDSDLVELFKQFPQLEGHTNDLDDAINELLKSLNNDMINDFSYQFNKLNTDEDINALQRFQDAVLNLGRVVGNTEIAIDIGVESENIDNLYKAINESISGSGLSDESIKNIKAMYSDLEGYDPSKLFEKTEHGIHLNVQALRALQSEYEYLNKLDIKESLQDLKQEYNNTKVELDRLTKGTEEYNQKQNELDGIENQIKDLQMLQAQYEGLTSAYNEWIEAQSTSNENDMYLKLSDSIEDIKKLFEEGWIGTDDFRTSIQLMTDENLDTAPVERLLEIYEKGIPAMEKFFTGNTDGLLNFLNTAKDVSEQLNQEWVKLDEDGKWHIDFGIGGDKEIAKAISEMTDLQISTEQVQILLRGLSSAGFDVNLDAAYASIEELQSRVEGTEQYLKAIGEEPIYINIYCDTEDLESEIQKAKDIIDEINNKDIDIKTKDALLSDLNAKLQVLIKNKIEADKQFLNPINIDLTNVNENLQGTLTKLQEYQNAVDNLKAVRLEGLDETSEEVQNATEKVQNLSDELKLVPEEVSTVLNLQEGSDVNSIIDQISNGEATLTIDGDISKVNEKIAEFDGQSVEVEVVTAGQKALDTLKNAINEIQDKVVTITALTVGKGNVDNLKKSINSLKDKNVKVQTNTKAILDAIDSIKNLKKSIDALRDKTVYVTTVKQTVSSGSSSSGNSVNRTANVNGTTGKAYAQGSWGAKDSGTALVGELGRETVVRDGKFFTVGDNGAEFFNYKRGDIIFNHEQSNQLFKYGRVTSGGGRAKSFANGNAFVEGNAFSNGLGSIYINGSVKTTASKSGSSSSSSEKDFKETFDWIEIAIDRIERAISKLDLTASSVYKNWTTRNKALTDEISKVNEEINLQNAAYNRYIKQANSVGLSEKYAKLVREGKIDISTITDEDLADKIKDYQTWYEKALDCKDAIDELNESLGDLYKQAFDNVKTQYDNILSLVEHEKNMLDEYITQSENKGYITSTKYYEALIKNEQSTIDKLKEEKSSLLSSLNSAVKSGAIEKYSQQWYEMVNAVDEVTVSIEKSNNAILEYKNNIRDIEWSVFDLLQNRISNITSEAEFLINLMSNDKLYDKKGQLTDQGMSTMGLYGFNYNIYMEQSKKYAKEISNIEKQLAKDPYNQDLIDRKQELLELQRESILAAEDQKDAIVDMVREGIELELDALQELIDKYNDALDSQKD